LIGIRLNLIFPLAAGVCLLTASIGLGDSGSRTRPRIEQPRINLLIQIIQSDPDENNRNAAVLELSRADPRLSTGVIQILSDAILKDQSPLVRQSAIGAIERYKAVFTLGGLALETAMERDASPEVRSAARQALWGYHLMGYKSVRDLDDFIRQTPEPPLAKPPGVKAPVTAEPPFKAEVAKAGPAAALQLPSLDLSPGPRVSLMLHQPETIHSLEPLPGPRVSLITLRPVPIAMLAALSPRPSRTVEPPLAHQNPQSVSPPIVREPPIQPHWPGPLSAGTPHPFAKDLPPMTWLPGTFPGESSIEDITAEPKIIKSDPK
jgi:hypothetical protein